jgi:hypothetical protein
MRTWRTVLAVVAVLAFTGTARAGVEPDHAARLLAGRALPADIALPADTARSRAYAAYVRALDKAWETYERRTLRPVGEWVGQQLDVRPNLVFYPFSGPDILNAVAFFPHSQRFLLVGLERIGPLPDSESTSIARILATLPEVRASLADILGLNFHRTRAMHGLGDVPPLRGTAAMILLFLSRTGHTITSVRSVAIDASGQIVASSSDPPSAGRTTPGIEVRFRAPGDQEDRVAYYFRCDLSNVGWQRSAPPIQRLLEREARVTTFLKAASYLMFKRRFSRIRQLILDRSDFLVQDASGIPFKHLQAGPWSLRLFGQYKTVNRLFGPFEQRRLRAAIRSSSLGRLPFPFGYDHRRGTSHLIVAARKPEVQPTKQ